MDNLNFFDKEDIITNKYIKSLSIILIIIFIILAIKTIYDYNHYNKFNKLINSEENIYKINNIKSLRKEVNELKQKEENLESQYSQLSVNQKNIITNIKDIKKLKTDEIELRSIYYSKGKYIIKAISNDYMKILEYRNALSKNLVDFGEIWLDEIREEKNINTEDVINYFTISIEVKNDQFKEN